jgi:uncharacterized protein (DUF1778 family)
MAFMATAESATRGRIHLRVDPEQEARLRAAAEADGQTLTGFLLSAAAARADEVLARATRIEVDAKAFDHFLAALEDPHPQPSQVLRRYAQEPSPLRAG